MTCPRAMNHLALRELLKVWRDAGSVTLAEFPCFLAQCREIEGRVEG